MPTPRKYATNAERQAAYRVRGTATAPTEAPIPPAPGYRRWARMLRQVQGLLTAVTEEMATYWEARSAVWQESERGEAFTERLEIVEALRDQVDDWEDADHR
jgi:hypothetical protein